MTDQHQTAVSNRFAILSFDNLFGIDLQLGFTVEKKEISFSRSSL